jgi:murein DD-endopeptidase MepM/ murein hydrolase activator NlpD
LNLSGFLSTAAAQSANAVNLALGMAARHPRRVLGALGAVLLGTGATAFAVATLAPDVSQISVREITEPLAININLPDSAQAQQALQPLPFTLYRSDTIRANDTADSLLRRLGVQDAGAASFIRNDAAARAALLGRAGRTVMAETHATHALQKLTARWISDDTSNSFQRFVLERNASGAVTSRVETGALVASTRLSSGVIRSSLFAATDEARIPDSVAVQLAEIFSSDIDFIRDLRKGDRFNVVYESLEADGEPMRAGRVLSAEFVNGGKKYEAVWFQEPGQKGQYYTLDGNSLRKAFLASPLEFSRVTSGFGGRMHPLARQWRMHNGVDYAAPTGTPVRTVGDGIVHFAGMQRGYGNVVEIMHRDGKSTLYAHLSRIAVRQGQRVEQGDNIGAVGSTGWSTGPHLHFEFRVAGVHHDPMTIAKQAGTVPLSAAARPAFDRVAAQMRRELVAAASLTLARAQ